MSLPSNYVGTDGDRCSCGRRASIRHCPSCGSFRIKIRPSARSVRQTEDGTEVVDRFKCDRCGFVFDDSMRKSCEAPVYMTKTDRLAAELVRAKAARQDGHPLTIRERQLLDATDPLTKRFNTEVPANGPASKILIPEKDIEPENVPAVNESLIRRLSAEYASRCIRTGQKASPTDKDAFISQRLKEISNG